jgi:hypothetical protein
VAGHKLWGKSAGQFAGRGAALLRLDMDRFAIVQIEYGEMISLRLKSR